MVDSPIHIKELYSPSSRTRAEVSTRCKASSPQTLWITRITANADRFYTLFRNPQPHCSKNKPRRRQHILHAELAEQLQLDVSFQVAYCEAAYTCDTSRRASTWLALFSSAALQARPSTCFAGSCRYSELPLPWLGVMEGLYYMSQRGDKRCVATRHR